MTTAAESHVGLKIDRSEATPALSASAPEATETENESIAEANQRIFSDLLEAFFQDRDEDEDEEDEGPDDVVTAGSPRVAAGCEKLTYEIIRLERLRKSVAQLVARHSGVPEAPQVLLQLLLEAYDRKIRDCEDELDHLLEPNRRRYAHCGILADYFVG